MASPEDAVAGLAARLSAAGRRIDADALGQLMEGIAAAPEGLAGPEWLELVGPDLDAETRRGLVELRAVLAARDDGLGDRAPPAGRLADLRAELRRRGLAGFLVPRADEHQGEYVPRRAQRLAWLTGFQGSAGLAVALEAKAAIFIDGRYTLQVRDQVDTALFEPVQIPENKPEDWIAANLPKGGKLGFDPWLHGPAEVERLRVACARAGAELAAVEGNPVDAIWRGRPSAPLAAVTPHPLEFAGEDAASKRARIGAIVAEKGADAALLTAPDSIAWLLNVRGGDVPRTPFPLGFALVSRDGAVDLFVDRRKVPDRTASWLGNGVAIAPPDALGDALETLGRRGATVLVDRASSPWWASDRLERAGAKALRDDDPVALPKACKNAAELAGVRAAHLRDGAAVTRYLHWLSVHAPSGRIGEIEASDRLEAFRAATGAIRDLSFDTISGAGPNGAIVHYRASPRTERRLTPGELYLVDSGGQYRDGTTDITRTVAIGAPDAEMRDRFTRVLKGHIALAAARFPAGTTGSQLDALARYPLWQAGLDYDHGTGHGVGAYLSVHEGPHRISKAANAVALRPGMIVSNEPGFYKTGAYGIRIENLVAVRESRIEGADRAYLEFETLTLAPIDLACIEPALLTEAERRWLDAYHARVRETLAPALDGEALAWLAEATRPL